MAILEAILTGEYQGQMTINRWHYIASGDNGPVTNSFGLLSAMGFVPPTASPWSFTAATIASSLQNLVSSAFGFKAFYVRNLYEVEDFIETAFNPLTVGKVGSLHASPTLAYGLQSSRVRTDIRRGSKRFAGVGEAGMGDGGIVIAPALDFLTLLATQMSAVLSYSSGGAALSFAPAVLGYEAYTTSSGKRAYRKYPTEAQQLAHTAQNVVYAPQTYVRTQTSRQYGHGA